MEQIQEHEHETRDEKGQETLEITNRVVGGGRVKSFCMLIRCCILCDDDAPQ